MRNKLLIFLLLISSYSFGQSVPNNEVFSLQDVYDAVHNHTPATIKTLQSCFDNAISGYFNATYNNNSYAPSNSMLRFRDYKPTGGCSVPTITTASITNIKPFSGDGGGNVTSDGGCSVTSRGVCYSTSTNPTLSNFYTSNGSGVGSFSSSLSVTCGTTYYVRAYATNSQGTAYGNEVSFTPSESALNIYSICFAVTTISCGNVLINSLATAQTAITYLKTCTLNSVSNSGLRAESLSVGQSTWDVSTSCTPNSRTWYVYTDGSYFTPSSNFYIVNSVGAVIQSVTLYP